MLQICALCLIRKVITATDFGQSWTYYRNPCLENWPDFTQYFKQTTQECAGTLSIILTWQEGQHLAVVSRWLAQARRMRNREREVGKEQRIEGRRSAKQTKGLLGPLPALPTAMTTEDLVGPGGSGWTCSRWSVLCGKAHHSLPLASQESGVAPASILLRLLASVITMRFPCKENSEDKIECVRVCVCVCVLVV